MKTQNYLLVLTTLVVTACQTRNTIEKNEITYATINEEKSYSLLNSPDNPKYELKLSFTYPETCKDEKILEKIRCLFLSSFFDNTYENYTPEEAVAQYIENKQHDYKALEDEFRKEMKNPDKGSLIRFFYHEMISNEVTFDENRLISFSVNTENYTGGAHPAHTLSNYVIDLRRGTFITESELFVDDFKNKMAQILVKRLAAQNELDDPKQLEQTGFFDIGKIAPNGNFLIDGSGVTYSFNEYEIAAYAVGTIHVHVPYDEIKNLLRKGNPIRHVVK
ncbi:MAG: DUF3298 and DUF4163 domain-containing protein [Prevotellaceae bacterium]|jgi:hypothetical protein|nr:DUF3298 and DUF4163 domain-containing protein [Prevotellaceae bacterium]